MSSKIDDLFHREKPDLKTVKAYLEPEKYEEFSKLCKSHGKSMSSAVKAMIEDLLAAQRRKVVPISVAPSELDSES